MRTEREPVLSTMFPQVFCSQTEGSWLNCRNVSTRTHSLGERLEQIVSERCLDVGRMQVSVANHGTGHHQGQ